MLFGAGGAEALIIRTQLAQPNQHVVSPEHLRRALLDARDHDDLLLHHPDDDGRVRELPDPADDRRAGHGLPAHERAQLLDLPRARRSSSTRASSLGSAPNAGWFDYVPLASTQFDPGRNIDFYCLGIIFNGISSTLTAAQFIVTIFKSRAPGMSFNRMPLFCFAFLAASFGLLFALPAADRRHDLPLPRPQRRHALLRRRRTAARRCSGSTSSGSSATRRSTS